MRRNFPMWSMHTLGSRTLSCVELDAYVKKSGKTGVGIVLALRPVAPKCSVELEAASLDIGGEPVAVSTLPAAQEVRAATYLYLAFPFDNEAAWNAGRNDGALRLRLRAGARSEQLVLSMRQHRDGSHVSDREETAPTLGSPAAEPGKPPPPTSNHEVPSAPLQPLPPNGSSEDFAEPPP